MAEDRGRRRSGLQGSKTLLVYTRTNILYIIFMYMLATLVCILILLAAERETAVYIYNCVIASSSMGGGVEWVMCWGGGCVRTRRAGRLARYILYVMRIIVIQ